jgi:hypothetical protein
MIMLKLHKGYRSHWHLYLQKIISFRQLKETSRAICVQVKVNYSWLLDSKTFNLAWG